MSRMHDSEGHKFPAKQQPVFDLTVCSDGSLGFSLADVEIKLPNGDKFETDGYMIASFEDVFNDFVKDAMDFAEPDCEALALAAMLRMYAARIEAAVACAKNNAH